MHSDNEQLPQRAIQTVQDNIPCPWTLRQHLQCSQDNVYNKQVQYYTVYTVGQSPRKMPGQPQWDVE